MNAPNKTSANVLVSFNLFPTTRIDNTKAKQNTTGFLLLIQTAVNIAKANAD
jgi:hypothetical protein